MENNELDIDSSHIAPLDADNIPNENQAHYCFSCEEPMKGAYCIACGQKNDDLRRGIFSLTWELFKSVTAIEGRIWRTWRSLLLQPGRVAREFANGRRSHWSSPIRIYLAMSIILFAFMGLTKTHLFGIDINVMPKDGIEKIESELTIDDVDIRFSQHWFPQQKDIDARNKDKNFELIALKLNSYTNDGKAEIADNDTRSSPQSNDENSNELNIDDLNIKIMNQPLNSQTGINFLIQFVRNPVMLTNSFNKWLPRVIFILMPFTILFSALFIRGRKDAMLYDHLVHAAYIHAIAFFFLFIGIVFSRVIAGNILSWILFITLLIYLPLSLKRMFNRGWLKTIWTSYGVGFFYMICLTMGLFTAIVSDIGQTVLS